MSGIFSQVGFANETRVPPVTTVGTSTAATIGSGTFTNLLTFGSAHGCNVGDVLILTGYTPSAWNGTWVVQTVPSSTTLTFISIVTLGPVTVQGTISASVYGSVIVGTAITPAPSRFSTYIKESFKLVADQIMSTGVGANRRVQASTRGVLGKRSAGGDLQIEVESKGAGFWLQHMIGPVVTTGPTDSAFTHTASWPTGVPVTNGRLGKTFNLQTNVVPIGGVNVELVKTYIGCKVTGWQLDFAEGQVLTLTLSVAARDERRNIVKASATYPVTPELLSFAGGTIQLAGQTWDVIKSGSIKVDLGLNTDRWTVRGSIFRKEPAEETMANITVDITGEFDSVLSVYDKVEASVFSQTLAQINLAFVGQILIGVSTFPSMTFNIPVARFDGDTPTTDGQVLPTQHLNAVVLWDSTNSPINCAYVTTDSTP